MNSMNNEPKRTPMGVYRIDGIGVAGRSLNGVRIHNLDELRVNDRGEVRLVKWLSSSTHRVPQLDNIDITDTWLYATKKIRKLGRK